MEMSQLAAINILGVSKQYGTTKAVQDISLLLAKGECVALVGHNGAGKSTLIKMILGLTKPTAGSLKVLQQDPKSRSFNDQRRNIGFLPEQVLFQKNMTGRETMAFYAHLKGLRHQNFDELLKRVDLLAAADRKVGTYSKGMRQRLGMAQALLGRPKLLVLDEPTTGLDPRARQNFYKIINEEKKAGSTVLISSHILTELDERIDRVVILNSGKLTVSGTIPDLRHKIGMKSKIVVTAKDTVCSILAERFFGSHQAHLVSAGKVALYCTVQEKVSLLSQILDLGEPIENIEMSEPSLEEVFNAYSTPETLESIHV